MEQQVTQEDILLIQVLVGLAENSLNNRMLELDDGGASLSDTAQQVYHTDLAETRNQFERAKEVLKKFGLY